MVVCFDFGVSYHIANDEDTEIGDETHVRKSLMTKSQGAGKVCVSSIKCCVWHF